MIKFDSITLESIVAFVFPIRSYLTLFNPALFGPYNIRGGADLSPTFFFFSELLEGVTCSRMGLKLSSPKKSSDKDPV